MLTKNYAYALHKICKFRVALVLTFVFFLDLVNNSSSIPDNKYIDRPAHAKHITPIVTGKKDFKK